MSDALSAQGSSPGSDSHDCTTARLNAQHQAVRDIADWLELIPDFFPHSFSTLTFRLSFPPCAEKASPGRIPAVRASCKWSAGVASTPEAVTPPPGKTSAFGPSSRFTLLSDQYYEAAGTAKGEDTISQARACADARIRALRMGMESAGKAGLCDQEGAAMRIAVSFAPPAPALIGGGRYGSSAFEAICDWNLIIEAVLPLPGDPRASAVSASPVADPHP